MISRFHHLAALWVAGNLVLALVTWACFQLGLNVATTGFGFLIAIVLLSHYDSFVSSVLFSIVAVGCLDYFFMEPLFSFTVASIEDIAALAAFLITSFVITDLVRRLRRLGGALMDVTAARRADEELHKVQAELAHLYSDLREREAKIRRLVDANIIGIYISEHEGRILEANDAFLQMVGYDREDLAAGRMRWTVMTPPEWLDRDVRTLLPELRTTGRLQPFEKEYLRKDGTRIPVLIGAATFEGGEHGVAFVLDLTERKRAEEARRELESELARMNRIRIMGELAGSLAHEITQPMGSARNNARAALNFLDQQPPDLDEVREALGSILGDADRAGDIIDRIRDHIRKASPRRTLFDLNRAINEVIELARTSIIKNSVSVQTRLADGLFPVQGDRVQVQQVVLNLILNAVEAMGSVEAGARELSISSEQNQTDGFLVAVRDSGLGIDPEQAERVFQAFYTTKSSGTGLGLSICRSIVDAHGGRLWAGANEPRGAIFQFTLPNAQKNS